MKTLYAIALILILVAPFGYKSLLVGDYFVNMDYYANELCENKNLPEKKCNGICQLTRELSNDTDSHENGFPSEFKEIEISSFVLPRNNYFHPVLLNLTERKVLLYDEQINVGFPARMIKPPCC
jgi:hypothetical protein